ncbi:NF041680 family putative transposase [Catenulispora pinisilvae]|uniref:NF041680 family putative transposase n=1 Tax=Catenulispora pinisilvae TaxID=2705253 RepID=UPI001891CE16|nr:NF041680 family putative transposase [Catenulispora pinisilvae]
MTSVSDPDARVEAIGVLSRFRTEFFGCLDARADGLFEVVEAMLCLDGPVVSVPELSLASVHRRGHGGLYDALASGKLNVARFTAVLAGLELPRFGGRITLAVDVSPWLRPDAECCDERMFCHVHGRGRGNAQMVPGWPYSFVVALEPGASSFTALLDAVRIGPDDDGTEVTAAQIRAVVQRLRAAGQHTDADRPVLVVTDSGYDGTRLAFLLADLPVELLVRVRSDRVYCAPAGARKGERPGRQPRHGPRMKLNDCSTWPVPDASARIDTARYGAAQIDAFARRHQRLAGDGAWAGHVGEYPIIAGTVLRVQVDRLPGDRAPKPLWLWSSAADISGLSLAGLFFAFCRRFDIEHTFRMWKQTLGWTRPRIRTAAAADLWTFLVIAAYTQLRLARRLAADLRRGWERPVADPDRLTPTRIRRGFRRLRPILPHPARPPKANRPGPGRPKGSKNKNRAPRHDVGKRTKTSGETTAAAPPPP